MVHLSAPRKPRYLWRFQKDDVFFICSYFENQPSTDVAVNKTSLRQFQAETRTYPGFASRNSSCVDQTCSAVVRKKLRVASSFIFKLYKSVGTVLRAASTLRG